MSALDNLAEALAAGLGGIVSATALYPIEMCVFYMASSRFAKATGFVRVISVYSAQMQEPNAGRC